MKFRPFVAAFLALGALVACSDDSLAPGEGRIAVRMTDAPFPLDDVASIDIFVVRVEAKTQATTEADAAADVEEDDAESDGWIVLAEPNDDFDLMDLRNGVTVFLGDAVVPQGNYQSFRLIIDTDHSTVTLKDGTVLSATSTPSIMFPSAGRSGIKVIMTDAIVVEDGATTDVLLDFDAEESFVLRGNTITQNGLLFKPVIKATIQDE
jgi:hypothetical protein